MRKYWILPGVILLGVLFLGYREYRVEQRPIPQIEGEKQFVLLRATSRNVFGMGHIDSPRAKALSRGMVSFFSSEKIVSIWDISVGNEYRGDDFSIQRISSNLVRSVCAGEVLWWIGDDFHEEEQRLAVQSGVSFESDWWVMTKNRLPEFLPIPSQGILYAGDRSPSQKTQTFAQNKKMPLISASETNGFLLSFVDGKWKLKMRD